MRLHRLELTAFGPFAATQSVDFDELSAAGLFLLHGPTGAGKTSVLDGVCFALYGQVPGARPATRLRSDHAAPGTVTEVVLELTLGGRRLEITRRPEQLRAKKRGTGLTPDKAVTLLREYKDGAWHGLSRSHQEAGEELRQLIGMSCEQFCQVVLLPQGEFATFLRASAVERGALLGRLFDTRRFKAVEHWLRDGKLDAERRLAQGDQDLTLLAAGMRQAAGPGFATDESDHGADPEPDSPARLLAWAAALRCDAREHHDIARTRLSLALASHSAAADAATAARDLHTLQNRHAEARRRSEALAAEHPTRTATRARLTRARRATSVEPALEFHDKAAARHEEASARERRAIAHLTSAGDPGDAGESVTIFELGPDAKESASSQGQEASDPAADPAGTAEQAPAPGAAEPTVGVRDTAPARGREAGVGHRSAAGLAASAERGPASGAGQLAVDDGEPVLSPGQDAAVRGRSAAGLVSAVEGVSAAVVAEPAHAQESALTRGQEAAVRDQPAADRAAVADQASGAAEPALDVRQSTPASQRGETVGRQAVAGIPRRRGPEDGSGRAANTPLLPQARSGFEVPVGGGADSPRADVFARRAGELREEVGALAGAGEVEARVREIAERRAALDREERDDEEAVREAQAWLERWPGMRGVLQARLDGALEAAGRAAGLAGELVAARRRRDAAGERDALVRESAHARDAARDARDRAAEAREVWQDRREARIAGIAAELAAGLAHGEPCRVCGSPDHPAPARPAGRQVTRADEDAAYAAFQRETSVYDRTRDEVARLHAALEAATAVAGDSPQTELAATCAVLEAGHAEAVRAAAAATEARGTLQRAEGERDRRAEYRQRAQSAIAARTSRREELDEQHERLSAELARSRAGFPSVAARRDRLSARIELLDRAAHAVRDRAESADRLSAARAALTTAADRAGFASPAEAAAALLPPASLADGELQAEAWAKEEAAADADLAAPGPAAAALLPPADPDTAQTALEAATRRLRAASSAESAATARSAELDLLGARAADRIRELAPARAEFTRIKRLSDLASANTAENQYRMELETYVLAARLEQVAAAAGVRLQRMSAGRYTLVHTDARGGGRSKSGLGLMVVDAWTGTERDTSTLSGGETFFASLALALGLADVVTDEAGGTRLDTLFIDEGFGSLDEQTLDEVLDVLDGLRERDRAVGIVSHVADLRHRIPAQLRVVKGRDGSSVRMRTGTGTGTGAGTGTRAGPATGADAVG